MIIKCILYYTQHFFNVFPFIKCIDKINNNYNTNGINYSVGKYNIFFVLICIILMGIIITKLLNSNVQ